MQVLETSEDQGILDPDDTVCDVVDDRDKVRTLIPPTEANTESLYHSSRSLGELNPISRTGLPSLPKDLKPQTMLEVSHVESRCDYILLKSCIWLHTSSIPGACPDISCWSALYFNQYMACNVASVPAVCESFSNFQLSSELLISGQTAHVSSLK